MGRAVRRIRIFLLLVWRKFDSKEIPAPYRNDERIGIKTAWEIAGILRPWRIR